MVLAGDVRRAPEEGVAADGEAARGAAHERQAQAARDALDGLVADGLEAVAVELGGRRAAAAGARAAAGLGCGREVRDTHDAVPEPRSLGDGEDSVLPARDQRDDVHSSPVSGCAP